MIDFNVRRIVPSTATSFLPTCLFPQKLNGFDLLRQGVRDTFDESGIEHELENLDDYPSYGIYDILRMVPFRCGVRIRHFRQPPSGGVPEFHLDECTSRQMASLVSRFRYSQAQGRWDSRVDPKNDSLAVRNHAVY